jgi:hypothetical protein
MDQEEQENDAWEDGGGVLWTDGHWVCLEK